MVVYAALLAIVNGCFFYWSGYLVGKRRGKAEELRLIEQTSADLCPRCGWRFYVPGVFGPGRGGCYNCDCREIANHRDGW